MHILVATDADYVLDEVLAAFSGADTSFTVCREGRDVSRMVTSRNPDLAIVDLQCGSMGGMAITMALRLDESSGAVPHVPILMLLDRRADVHLAKRSAADAWVIKPLDAITLQRAAHAILHPEPATEAGDGPADPDGAEISVSSEEETVTAG